MDRYLSIQAFVKVAEKESFAEAARQLGVARSVVTERIKQLESFVEAPLFHRTTRSVKLSEIGTAFFKECSDLVTRLEGLTNQMRDLKGTPKGVLRLHVLPGFALGHLSLVLREYQEQYPNVQLDIVVNDRVVDPVDEGYDVALQIFEPALDVLIAKRLFPIRRLFLASPEYIARLGMPRRPEELLRHRLGVYARYPTGHHWQFWRGKHKVEIELPASLRSNSVHLLKEYALSGAPDAGFVRLSTVILLADSSRPDDAPLHSESSPVCRLHRAQVPRRTPLGSGADHQRLPAPRRYRDQREPPPAILTPHCSEYPNNGFGRIAIVRLMRHS